MKKIFESYNARYLSIDEVSQTFIPNKDFERLYQKGHSILMGPRGCGKTTLFKMLTPKALFDFQNRIEDNHVLKFWGIYIPADKQWDRQLRNFQAKFTSSSFPTIVTKAIINANILNSILDTFRDLLDIYIADEQIKLDYQVKLSKELLDAWDLPTSGSFSFMEIKKKINLRIRDINVLINKVELGIISVDNINYEDYFFHNYLDLSNSAFDIFENTLFSESFIQASPCNWALCFDELEIVPDWVTQELLELNLRSTSNQRILFKLATAPLIDWEDKYSLGKLKTQAQNKNDFIAIRSWVYNYQSRKDWESFCENFILSKITSKDIDKQNIVQLFGTHNLNNALWISEKNIGNIKNYSDEANDFNEGSLMYSITQKLAQQDKSFHTFLIKKNIDPLHPVPSDPKLLDSVLRKSKHIIVYRYYFYKRSSLRSRKSISLYHGYPYISELADGNPRVLINLLDSFFSKYLKNISENDTKLIPLRAQGNIIYKFSTDHFNQITNHPEAATYIQVGDRKQLITLKKLLIIIGNWFFNKMIREPFKMDLTNCFTIDEKVPSEIIALLKLAIDLGAIHYLAEDDDLVLSSSTYKNSVFRLSYILNPYFRLPKRTDGSIRLSTILNDTIFADGNAANDVNQTEIKWED